MLIQQLLTEVATQNANLIEHRVQRILDALSDLRNMTVSLFSHTQTDPQTINDWLLSERFEQDQKGFFRRKAILDRSPEDELPGDTISYTWPRQRWNTDAVRARMFALRGIGVILQGIRTRIPDIARLYYQDTEGVTLQQPLVDPAKVIPLDFDWKSSRTYQTLDPEHNTSQAVCWTPPFIDFAGEGLIVSVCIPVWVDEVYCGLWSADIPLHRIHDGLHKVPALPDMEMFIIDPTGHFIMHPGYMPEIDRQCGSIHQESIACIGGDFSRIPDMTEQERMFPRLRLYDQNNKGFHTRIHKLNSVDWILVSRLPDALDEEVTHESLHEALDRMRKGDFRVRVDTAVLDGDYAILADMVNDLARLIESGRIEKERIIQRLQSKELFLESSGRLARIGGWRLDLKTGDIEWTQSAREIIGLPDGMRLDQDDIDRVLPDEGYDAFLEKFEKCIADGAPFDMIMLAHNLQREPRWIRNIGYPEYRDGECVAVAGVFQDVTRQQIAGEREQHINKVLRAIRNVNQLITQETDRDILIQNACEILTEKKGFEHALIILFNEEEERWLTASAGQHCHLDVSQLSGQDVTFPDCIQKALDTDGLVTILNPSLECAHCPVALEFSRTSAMLIRLSYQGQFYGMISVAVPRGLVGDEEEQGLFEEIASDISFALYKIATENALRRSEEQLSGFFDNSAAGLVIFDSNLRYLRINKAMADMNGFTVQEHLGRTLEDIVPQYVSQFEPMLRRVLQTGKPLQNIETTVQVGEPGSTAIHLLLNLFPVTGAGGIPEGVGVVAMNITGQRTIEEKLRVAYGIINRSPAVAFVWKNEPGWPVEYVSENISQLFGYTARYFIDQKVVYRSLVHPDDAPHLDRTMELALKNRQEELVNDPYRIRTRDGEYRWVEERTQLVWQNDCLQRLEGIVLDVTDRVRSQIALKEREWLYRVLTSNYPKGALFIYDNDLRYTFCEGRALRRENIDPASIIGKRIDEVWFPNMLEVILPTNKKILEGEEVFYEVEFQGHVYENHGVPLITDEGQVIGGMVYAHDITVRKQAEQELLNKTTELENILVALPDAIVYADVERRIVKVNPAFTRLFGYQPVEVIGQSTRILYRSDEEFLEQGRKRYNPDARNVYEPYLIHHRRKDGSEFISESMGTPVRDAQDNVVGLLGIVRDITERINQMKALEVSENKFRSYVENAPYGIFIADQEGFYVEVNKAACEQTGYSREQLVGKHLTEMIAPERIEHTRTSFRNVKTTGWTQNRTVCIRADGTRRHWNILAVRLDDNRFLGFTSDVTDRIEAEKKLRFAERSIEHTLYSVFWIHKDGSFFNVNQTACDILGYTRKEFLRLGVHDIDPNYPIEQRPTLWQNLLRKKKLVLETIHRKKDGSGVPVEVLTHYLKFEQDEYEVAMARDISERVAAEKEKSLLEDQIRESRKIEALGRLAGGVAHDLNNLLSPILGYGELLLEEISVQDERHEAVEEIRKAGLRARDLVRQLLAFGRRQTLSMKPVNLNQIITGFEKLLRRTIREDIRIESTLTPELPNILADTGQIEQVIMNLSVNAQDAMPGGGLLELFTSLVELDQTYVSAHADVQPGWYVMLAISDNGSGMDEETRSRIFDPFFTTKEKGKGTGLGLATVYGIIRQHNGSIWVYSEPQQGTTFKLYFPVAEEKELPAEQHSAAENRVTGHETVFVVEDEDSVRKLAVRILVKLGYNVHSARSGIDCLRQLESLRDPLDLLVTDVVMPGMNGRELYGKVKQVHPEARVLYMSGYTDNVIAHHGILDQGVHFIQKPFPVQSLAAKVREALEEGIQ